LTGAFQSLLGFRDGGVFNGGRVQPFASGGIISSPTYFPLSGATGLMGEAGAEAVMPLQRGPDGKLGVAGGGTQAPVNVTFNVSTPDTQGFAQSQAQITSMLARAVGRGRRGL
jgi:phage-related minor tail protein